MGTEYKMSPDYSAAKKEKLDYTSGLPELAL